MDTANERENRRLAFIATGRCHHAIERERNRLTEELGREATITMAIHSLIAQGAREREAMAK